jgi:hypothetical protein
MMPLNRKIIYVATVNHTDICIGAGVQKKEE